MGFFNFFKNEKKVYDSDYKINYLVRTSKYKSFRSYGTIGEIEEEIDKYIDNYWAIESIYNEDGSYNNELTIKYSEETRYDDLFNGNTHFTTDHNLYKIQKYNINYLYHITHIDNLKSIIDNGLLAHNNKYVKRKIDNEDVNEHRSRKEPLYGKSIHNYVPLYFNPKNPMLYVNKELQKNIVILEFTNTLMLNNMITENISIFTDGNASVKSTNFYNNLNDLEKLDWDCIYSKKWTNYNDGKRKVMAEVLVENYISSDYIENIYCYDKESKEKINSLNNYICVVIDKTKYFD